jgi:DNA-binding beta-propeller fold protein YncE
MKIKVILLSSLLLSTSFATAETVFVTLEKDNAIAVVDPIAGKLLKTVNVGQRPVAQFLC